MVLIFSMDFEQVNNKSETFKFQRSEIQKSESNLTFMQTFDVNVSENVNSVQEVNRGGYKRIPMELPPETKGEFKTYMDYRCITSTGSPQWELQQQAYTGEYGFRKIGDKYMVALGTYYSETVGDEFHITLDSGIEFNVIVGDIKATQHTDDTNRYIEKNGNICEFIVNTDVLNETAVIMGDVSYAGFEGEIVKIERLVK